MSSSPRSYAFPLALKRLEHSARYSESAWQDLPQYLIQGTAGQNFHLPPEATCGKGFTDVVHKDREAYQCERPFRAVAKLGSRRYAFALDSTRFAEGYDTLYFDAGGSGDLTRAQVIRALPKQPHEDPTCKSRVFPRVDLTVDADGELLEYGFFITANVYRRHNQVFVSAGLSPGVYREGSLELAGQRRHVLLVDWNANGRFNDESTVQALGDGDDALLLPTPADELYVGPDVSGQPPDAVMRAAEQYTTWVSRIRRIAGRFYTFAVSPSGDTLRVSETGMEVGRLRPALTGRYTAEWHGPLGALTVHGTGGEPAELPEGQWQLLTYWLDPTGWPAATQVTAGEPTPFGYSSRTPELWRLFGTGPPEALVQGVGTRRCQLLEVQAGQTCDAVFGPPYRPVVKLEPDQSGSVRLDLRLLGAGGEVCLPWTIKGQRVECLFTIASSDGRVVERGTFEYG